MLLSPCRRTQDVLLSSLCPLQLKSCCLPVGKEGDVGFLTYMKARGKNMGKSVPSGLLTEVETLAMNWQVLLL